MENFRLRTLKTIKVLNLMLTTYGTHWKISRKYGQKNVNICA